ncbi:YmdB family metallophosphoesterase [bacterium]|nr:YmdB family metallophosphoesterase [bacterium]
MENIQNKIKILFFGDIAGKPGRLAVKNFLTEYSNNFDFIIANVENASHGFGLTEKNYYELSEYGIDCMTSGNHIWDKKDVFEYINKADKLIRPANYPDAPGVGYKVFETSKGKIGVINVLGRHFMPVFDSPRYVAEEYIKKIQKETNVIFIDFHAEATAEKMCYARYFSDLGLSVFVGTHTHVQTADEKIINNRTAYISDVGFCGDSEGIIGMDYESSLKHTFTMLPSRFEVASSGKVCINGVAVTVNTMNGYAEDIKRINVIKEL